MHVLHLSNKMLLWEHFIVLPVFYGSLQCRAGQGACPDTSDTTAGGSCTNDVSDVSGFVQDGQQCISFTRPFNPGEKLVQQWQNKVYYI